MNKKITSSALAALMIAGSTSFSAFAAMSNGTVVIGNKAFDLAYANDAKNLTEITAAMVAGGAVYVKNFEGNWINNLTGTTVAASVIPAVTYKNATGVVTSYPAEDKDAAAVTVSAISAKSFKVVFNQAVTDTSKVVFAVSRTSSPLTVTTEWNAAKTEAILSNVANLPEAEYSINVKKDSVDLGTTKVSITPQKVAKINITSSKLGVYTDQKTSLQTGFAVYNVIDQYGVEVTNGSLANNIQFNTGVGAISASKGVIKVTPATGINLLTFTSGVIITANDTNSGLMATANLAVTSQNGTLSDIKLNKLTNVDNKVLTAGSTTDVFYIDYVATDVSGNPTTNYDMVRKGLIFQTLDNQFLNIGSPYVTAEVKQDPKDSNKAVIEVRATNENISAAMPLTLSAMTWTGKQSQISTEIKKQAEVYRVVLSAPDQDIASGESKVIPYLATDQNGAVLTKYEDLRNVTFTNAIATRDTDGKLLLKNTPLTNNGTSSITQVISASVPNSNNGYNSITVNIQKPAMADTLKLDSDVLNTVMQSAYGSQAVAEQTIDFGWDNGGLEVRDQYDRPVDMDDATDVVGKKYKVVPSSTDSSVIAVTGFATSGQNSIGITAGKVGSATVRFDLFDTTTGKIVDTKSQTFTSLKNSDIKGYMVEELTAPIFINYAKETKVTDAHMQYDFNPTVYGKTSTGGKVVLRGTPIAGVAVDNSDFTVFAGNNGNSAPDAVEVGANKLSDTSKTGSKATLSVYINAYDSDDNLTVTSYTATTPITSSTIDPIASKLKVSYKTTIAGVTEKDDVITVDLRADQAAIGLVKGNYMTRFDKDGNQKNASIYFRAYDQYSNKSTTVSQVQTLGTTTSGFEVSRNGEITHAATAPGEVTLTGFTNNGLNKTVKIKFVDGTNAGNNELVIASVALINVGSASVSNYSNAGITGVTSANLGDVNTAVAAHKLAANRVLTLDEIKADVAKVVGAPTVITALSTLNDSTSVATMRAALEDTKLGLNLTVYNQLNSLNKNTVATDVLAVLAGLNKGFENVTAVQNALNDTKAIKAVVVVVTPVEVATKEYAASLASINNSLLGGTVVGDKINVTDAAATTGTGVFENLKTLKVSSIKLGNTEIAINYATPNYDVVKAAVLKYFGSNLIEGTKVVLTVAGSNGTSVTVPYTLVNAIK
ncbi:cell wall-binding repeat-containing protein [Clostridium tagluense]|uniref:cell wall-binding repeat-containing protein n=1 Tax=Clostridium tagluense TaxID=360422 RepID=UPI001C0DD71B|nr:cell wall-binding repeat-containing protein [Clostridium tagluense]MBU3127137.1 cell wall-binding repeat-containing protein [Clostridium tagluense]MCB2312005.1 cell wall-binding repeat-containing protein [Clostridium tagluense]MCB2316592.1 cell wall-binding repeat-containing protein [Clostridium tagluense]MCB2321472.1 cell wall-binding repeat-containing protein [Clostridium tagluense]MCB2326484.1 cell wall-binding repeat-containing protein [Clostridium tagluense]